VALIGADTAQDVHPSGYPALRSPVHAVGIVAMGLWLLDNCDLEPLAALWAELDPYSFFFQVAPLRVAGGTGSPTNPIALFYVTGEPGLQGGTTGSLSSMLRA
jgi:hypothetical protein